jgi:hypothetical protein
VRRERPIRLLADLFVDWEKLPQRHIKLSNRTTTESHCRSTRV